MFTTSLAVVAVAGLLTPGSVAGQPDWAPDYAAALSRAAELRKPVAVFLTSGDLTRLTQGEKLGSDVGKTLSTHYVAVQIDTTTESGKKMADAFHMKEGVVISDRTGASIALKHEGAVAATELADYLNRFSGQTVVAATEYRIAGGASPLYPSQVVPSYPAPNRPVLNAIQNFNTTVFGQPLIGGS